MSELVKRVLVAIVGIPAAFAIVLLGGWFFFVAITAISTLALWEFYTITEKKGWKPIKMLGMTNGILLNLLAFYFWQYTEMGFMDFIKHFVTMNMFFTIMVLINQLFAKNTNTYAHVGTMLAGHYYITISFFTLLSLRFNTHISINNNSYFILLIFCSIWICDSAAYFIGKKFGKYKLLERVSPKKTIEGAVAGFIASAIFFPVVSHFILPDFATLHSIIIGLIIGIFGQLGDLIESKFKRDANVKDSSNIIPGHGGILDRFDSIIFVSPIIFIYLLYFAI